MTITIPPDYQPTEKEPFMNDVMLEYFRRKLVFWRDNLLRDSSQTLQNLQEPESWSADQSDRAMAETDRSIELRTRDRARKLIQKLTMLCSGSKTATTAIVSTQASRLALNG